jgi:hypothetical protein
VGGSVWLLENFTGAANLSHLKLHGISQTNSMSEVTS